MSVWRSSAGLLLFLLSFFLCVLVVLAVGVQKFVPPGEGGGVVSDEVHVVEVMETGAGVERDQVEGVQRDVVTTDREVREESEVSGILNKQKVIFIGGK